jgi:hypothetical protein
MNPLEQRGLLALRPLPSQVTTLLQKLAAPPRLVAHLILVHDVAAQLLAALQRHWPDLPIDAPAMLMGAAVHDIGKVQHPDELTGPGQQHEHDGPALLVRWGVEPRLARFAQSHGAWRTQPNLDLEDLLVALADTCWKGGRDQALEQRVAERLTAASGSDPWEVFIKLDDIVERISADADARLAWQAQFPVNRTFDPRS